MEKIDGDAIKKLATILHSRGVDYDTGLNISLRVQFSTQRMIDWLEENPDASVEEMCQKSRELHKADKAARWEEKRVEELMETLKPWDGKIDPEKYGVL